MEEELCQFEEAPEVVLVGAHSLLVGGHERVEGVGGEEEGSRDTCSSSKVDCSMT